MNCNLFKIDISRETDTEWWEEEAVVEKGVLYLEEKNVRRSPCSWSTCQVIPWGDPLLLVCLVQLPLAPLWNRMGFDAS